MKNLTPMLASSGWLMFLFRLLLLMLLLTLTGWLLVETSVFIRLFDVTIVSALPLPEV